MKQTTGITSHNEDMLSAATDDNNYDNGEDDDMQATLYVERML